MAERNDSSIGRKAVLDARARSHDRGAHMRVSGWKAKWKASLEGKPSEGGSSWLSSGRALRESRKAARKVEAGEGSNPGPWRD